MVSRDSVVPVVLSPCVRNCCLDDKDVCLGCGRTLDEIRAWTSLNDSERRKVLIQASERKQSRTPGFDF